MYKETKNGLLGGLGFSAFVMWGLFSSKSISQTAKIFYTISPCIIIPSYFYLTEYNKLHAYETFLAVKYKEQC